jgi:peptidylprolyl isomerase
VRAQAADWGELKRIAAPWSKRLLVPDGPSPRRVLIRDLKVGSGPVIQSGQSFWANYATFFYGGGELRQEVWGASPERFTWNDGHHVDAWVAGLKGMRVGGVRELVAPSSWAYGDGPLVYLIKLVKVEPI